MYEIELDSYKFRRLSDAVIEHERPSQSLPRVWSAFQFRAVAGVKVDSLLDMLDGLFGLPFTPILGYFSVATTFFLYKKNNRNFSKSRPKVAIIPFGGGVKIGISRSLEHFSVRFTNKQARFRSNWWLFSHAAFETVKLHRQMCIY